MNNKVLQCAMSLDIGGAETHVVALSKGLKQRGFDVLVASNGGVFEKDLKALDIKTQAVPMHSKHPLYVVKSLFKLRKIIKTFKPDVVHAHARIPALYVNILSKFYDFKMVTTVHGTFKVNPLLKRITRWGNHVFSVSSDITDYLISNYDMGKSEITETVNGIDLQVFKPKTHESTNKTMVHVSRLEKTTSKTAAYLIKYAIKHKRSLLIFGDGSELNRLKDLAQGYEHIELRGATEAVEEGLKEGSVFVGISRAALEAMAMNMPVILAGDYGVVGYLDEEKALKSKEHNFTGRNQIPLSFEVLENHLEQYYTKDFNKDSTWSRDFVTKYYSQDKMVDDYIKGYKIEKRIFVIGYYGSHNLGDEFLLYETLQLLTQYFLKENITALSYSVKETMKIHGVQCVSRNSLIKIMKTIKQADVIIGGGGSMLQNVTSNRSLFYYLWLLNYATLKKKSVALIGNGIGPIKGHFQSKWSKNILRKLDYIHLRDDKSYEWLKSDEGLKMDAGVDLALSASLEEKHIWGNKIYINLRKWKNTHVLVTLLLNFKSYLVKNGYEVEFIAMQKGNDDVAMESLGPVKTFGSPDELLSKLKTGDLVIGMRLHLLILAANYGIPFIGLSYDPKVSYYCDLFDQPYYEDFEAISLENLIDTFEDQIQNIEKNHKAIRDKHDILKQKNNGIHDYLKSISN